MQLGYQQKLQLARKEGVFFTTKDALNQQIRFDVTCESGFTCDIQSYLHVYIYNLSFWYFRGNRSRQNTNVNYNQNFKVLGLFLLNSSFNEDLSEGMPNFVPVNYK